LDVSLDDYRDVAAWKDRSSLFGLIRVDPHMKDHVYVTTVRRPGKPGTSLPAILMSNDGGDTWASLQSPVRSCWVLEGSPHKPNWLYAADRDTGVYFSKNGGRTWQQRFGLTHVTCIVPSRGDPDVVYVAADAGYRRQPKAGVFRTANDGRTWQDLTGNLPHLRIMFLLEDPLERGRLYVGTRGGGAFTAADSVGLRRPVAGTSAAETTTMLVALDELQGEWAVVSGAPAGEGLRHWKGTSLLVTDDVMAIRREGKTRRGKLSIDPTRTPKRMTILNDDGERVECIYKVDGDTLAICLSPPERGPPSDLDPDGAAAQVLLRCRRRRCRPDANLARLQGRWVIESVVFNGKTLERFVGGITVFAGDRSMTTSQGKTTYGGITVDTKRLPHRMTTIGEDGTKRYSIFKVEGDTLTTCRSVSPGAEPPVEFTAGEGSGRLLVRCRR